MPHFVYLARCADDSLYVGTCVDLIAREKLHNEGKASKYTRSRIPVTFVYHEEHPTLSAVRKREAVLKQLSRLAKRALIEAKQPSPTPSACHGSYTQATDGKTHAQGAQGVRHSTDRQA